jgi:hypothetical protein
MGKHKTTTKIFHFAESARTAGVKAKIVQKATDNDNPKTRVSL